MYRLTAATLLLLQGCGVDLKSAEREAGTEFCERAIFCGLWVPSELDECVDHMAEVFNLTWPDHVCEDGITSSSLDECLDEIAVQRCRDLRWNIDLLENCSSLAVCGAE